MIKIVADSSLDTDKDILDGIKVEKVPFKINLDDKVHVDDENLVMNEYVREMQASSSFSTACPSPMEYLECFEGDEDVFGITITSKLSGSYNSAKIAMEMYFEEHRDSKKRIHIFDSKLASVGETLIAMKIKELQGTLDFDEMKKRVQEYVDSLTLFFISESLDNLMKAGRLTKVKGTVAKMLNIVPLMTTNDGEIELFEKARGKKKAFKKLIESVAAQRADFSDRVFAIAHADNLEMANKIREEIEERLNFKKVIILPMSGLNTLYADYKGIIVAF